MQVSKVSLDCKGLCRCVSVNAYVDVALGPAACHVQSGNAQVHGWGGILRYPPRVQGCAQQAARRYPRIFTKQRALLCTIAPSGACLYPRSHCRAVYEILVSEGSSMGSMMNPPYP